MTVENTFSSLNKKEFSALNKNASLNKSTMRKTDGNVNKSKVAKTYADVVKNKNYDTKI